MENQSNTRCRALAAAAAAVLALSPFAYARIDPPAGLAPNAFNATLPEARTNLGIYQFNPVRDHAAPIDGTTDATAAIAASLTDCGTAGGGQVVLGPYRFLIDSADLTIPASCHITGKPAAEAIYTTAANWVTSKHTLVVNPTYKLKSGGQNAGIDGVTIVRKGLVAPTSAQQGNAQILAFAGTAVRVDHPDFTLSAFIMGFAQCVDSQSDRLRVGWLYGDCTAGLLVNNSQDVARIGTAHFWPFYIANTAYNWVYQDVTGAANNGSGLVRLTVADSSGFLTGNIVQVAQVGGVTAADGRWTITVVDATHIDLQGSTFSGAYTSGGSINLNNTMRTGAAIKIVDGAATICDSCFSYGYDIGAEVSGAASFTTFKWLGLDGALDPTQLGDTIPVGLKIAGTANQTVVNSGFISSKATAILHSSTTPSHPSQITNMMIGATGVRAIDMQAGSLYVANSRTSGSAAPNYIADAVVHLGLVNMALGTTPFAYQTSANVNKVAILGDDNGDVTGRNVAGRTQLLAGNLATGNYIGINSQVAGQTPTVTAGGTDANVGISNVSKGTGFHAFSTSNGWQAAVLDGGASTVNQILLKGSPTNTAVTLGAQGSDSNVSVNLVPKGTGTVKINGTAVAASNTYNALPGNPSGTTSTAVNVMMGLAGAITPASTGKVLIIISGIVTNNTAGDGIGMALAYGTGTAPTNGAAAAGTVCANTPQVTQVVAANKYIPFTMHCLATLTVGTAYWLDLELKAITGGTASAASLTLSAAEL